MFTKIIIVPDGKDSLDKRINREVLKEDSNTHMEVKSFMEVKKPHLECKNGQPYWVTLWEKDEKEQVNTKLS